MRFCIVFFIFSIGFGQQSKKVDFISSATNLILNEQSKTVSGLQTMIFKVASTIDSIGIDAQNMEFSKVFVNNKPVQFKNTKKQLVLFEGYQIGTNKISFKFEAKPKQTLYFIGTKAADNLQIWTQGQGKNTSHWLPSFDDVNEKLIFDISLTFDSDYKVISNGKLVKIGRAHV